MIRPVEFAPRIDSRRVVEIAAKRGITLTIGEADEFLKKNVTAMNDAAQRAVEIFVGLNV